MIFRVLNRGKARDEIFGKDFDDAAFEKVLLETQEQVFVRILCYCLMPIIGTWYFGRCTMETWGVSCSD